MFSPQYICGFILNIADFEGDFLSGDYPIHDDDTPGPSYHHPSPDFSPLSPDAYDTSSMIQRSSQDEGDIDRLKRLVCEISQP